MAWQEALLGACIGKCFAKKVCLTVENENLTLYSAQGMGYKVRYVRVQYLLMIESLIFFWTTLNFKIKKIKI